MRIGKIGLAIAVLFAAAFGHRPAVANDDHHGVCGGDLLASANIDAVYNPFSPSGLTATSVNFTVYRSVGGGGAKTQTLWFYLKPTTSTIPTETQITYSGVNFLAPPSGPFPTMIATPVATGSVQAFSGSPAGYIGVGFGGTSQPDSRTFTVNFSFGANWNVSAGDTINFDMVYLCKGTGGYDDVTTPTTKATAVTVHVTVVSALQASYAGPALDFGEIGQVTNAQAGSHSVSGHFNVQSSGPYTVTLSSGNQYLLTYPSGPTSPGNGNIKYKIDFLSSTKDYGSPYFGAKTCNPAGIGTNHTLGITATLEEGGSGKTPSSQYQDMLTVTFTPVVFAFYGSPCS